MEGSTTLKSYLEQNHSFLKNVVSFSPEDLLERITEFDLYDIKHEDKQIIEKIIEHINSTNTMPIWWSEQESSYLKKISSHKNRAPYFITFFNIFNEQ